MTPRRLCCSARSAGADALQLRRLRHGCTGWGEPASSPDDDVVAGAVWDLSGATVLAEHVRRPVQRLARVLAAGRVAMEAGGSAEDVLWALWEASGLGLAARWDADSRGGGSTGARPADRDLDAIVDMLRRGGEVHGSAARRVTAGLLRTPDGAAGSGRVVQPSRAAVLRRCAC